MRQLIIGMGEIGNALYSILEEHYEDIRGLDPFQSDYRWTADLDTHRWDVIHICFPYSNEFEEAVESYKRECLIDKGIIIIHSTVPIGVSNKLNAVFSPIRGLHPNLIKGIKTFVKYFGGYRAYEASKIFEACGVKTKVYEKAIDVEAGKILDTAQFGWNILLNKELKKWCEKYGVNFEIAYREFNESYNKGYTELGKSHFNRPIIDYVDGKIGGHCVMQNLEFLDSDISKIIKEKNELYK